MSVEFSPYVAVAPAGAAHVLERSSAGVPNKRGGGRGGWGWAWAWSGGGGGPFPVQLLTDAIDTFGNQLGFRFSSYGAAH